LDAQPAAFTDSVSRNGLVSGTWSLYASGELRVKTVHRSGHRDTKEDIAISLGFWRTDGASWCN